MFILAVCVSGAEVYRWPYQLWRARDRRLGPKVHYEHPERLLLSGRAGLRSQVLRVGNSPPVGGGKSPRGEGKHLKEPNRSIFYFSEDKY